MQFLRQGPQPCTGIKARRAPWPHHSNENRALTPSSLVQDFQRMDDKAAWVSSSQDMQSPKAAQRLLNPALSATAGGSVGLTVLHPSQVMPDAVAPAAEEKVPLKGHSYRWVLCDCGCARSAEACAEPSSAPMCGVKIGSWTTSLSLQS